MLKLHYLPHTGPRRYLQVVWRMWRAKRRVRRACTDACQRSEYFILLTKRIGWNFAEVSGLCEQTGYGIYEDVGPDPRQKYDGQYTIFWEASVGIVVYLGDRPALGLGVELRGDVLHVLQMQGAPKLELPKGLQNWPRLLLASCVEFAHAAGLAEVRVHRADQGIYYHAPAILPRSGETYGQVVTQYQQRMRRRYDGTARQLKFEKHKLEYVWRNPDYRPR